jgi:glycosyltransferase involved in cell wall biosynthesis
MTRNRYAWTGAWNREHNNARYAELLPRLAAVDRYYVGMHPWWLIRGIRRRMQLPILSVALGFTYPAIFCTDWRQLRLFRASCVVDHDDPVYSLAELVALARRNVTLIVVPTASIRNRLLAAGLPKPVEVIPQGISIQAADPSRAQEIRSRISPEPDAVVAGIHQPHFDFADELGGAAAQQMYAVDELFAMLEVARAKDPRLQLWLVGKPSARVEEYARRNTWVRLAGYQPRSLLMDYVSAFDIGIYPRRLDLGGRSSIKVLEYMACGVPVVGFDVEEMGLAAASRAGIAAKEPDGFVQALHTVANDPARRREMGSFGRTVANQFDWDILARKYQQLLDEALPPSRNLGAGSGRGRTGS